MNHSASAAHLFYVNVRYAVGVWHCCASVLGCPANALAARYAWKFARSGDPSLLHQWFVFSMAVADFLFLAIVAPAQFVQFSYRASFSRIPCSLLYAVSHCSTVASSLSLLALNVDKFLAVYRPLQHASVLSGRRVAAVVIGYWTVSIGWSAFFVSESVIVYHHRCLVTLTSFAYYVAFAALFFIGPTALATAISVFIAIAVKRRFSNAAMSYRKTLVVHEERSDSPQPAARNSIVTLNRSARRIRFVFTTTIWSCLTVIPYRVVYSLSRSASANSQTRWALAAMLCLVLMVANPVGNAVITICRQWRYKREAKREWERARAVIERLLQHGIGAKGSAQKGQRAKQQRPQCGMHLPLLRGKTTAM